MRSSDIERVRNDNSNNDKERTESARSARSQGTTAEILCEGRGHRLHSFEECLL
jgi:hypothetical protein